MKIKSDYRKEARQEKTSQLFERKKMCSHCFSQLSKFYVNFVVRKTCTKQKSQFNEQLFILFSILHFITKLKIDTDKRQGARQEETHNSLKEKKCAHTVIPS